MQFDKSNFSQERLIQLYKNLLFPRMIEEKMLVLLRQGKISKWFSGIGQEAISVGATMALQDDEWIMPLHRNLGVFTSRGMPLHKLVKQWQGSRNGYSKGRERSFHFGSREHFICGMISHLGPQLAVSAGVALAYKLKQQNKVSLAFTGDGGTSEGDFHEALNTAAVWDLPVIFIIENNGYGLSTPVHEQYRCENLVDRARGYGMEGVRIDGNNVLSVYQTVEGVRDYCIRHQKPYLIECMTFRMRGHEEASGTKYIPKEIFEEWQQKDPIKNYEEFILAEGVLHTGDVEAIRREYKEHIEAELQAGWEDEPMVPDSAEEVNDVYKEKSGVSSRERGEKSGVGSREPGVSSLESSVGSREPGEKSGVGSREPGVSSQESAVGSREGGEKSGVGSPEPGAREPVVSGEERGIGLEESNGPRGQRFIDAISEGLFQSMEAHSNLVLMGQDIAEYGGAFKITEGFLKSFGKARVRNTPLCESAIIGMCLGLSLEGYKSMMEMQFGDFVTAGFNQIVNNLAKIHYRWGQPADVVIRMPTGGGVGAGPFHSQTNEAWFAHTPGLKIVYPSTPMDAKGLLIAAINDPNPVMFFEHKALYRSTSGPVSSDYYETEIGKARIVQEGTDITVITYGMGVQWAAGYAREHKEISMYILDLRTLLPLDYDAIKTSVEKTGKVLVLHEDTLTGGLGGEVAAWIGEHCFEFLDAPVMRCASLDTPVPFNPVLEQSFLASSRLDDMVKKLVGY